MSLSQLYTWCLNNMRKCLVIQLPFVSKVMTTWSEVAQHKICKPLPPPATLHSQPKKCTGRHSTMEEQWHLVLHTAAAPTTTWAPHKGLVTPLWHPEWFASEKEGKEEAITPRKHPQKSLLAPWSQPASENCFVNLNHPCSKNRMGIWIKYL